MFYKIKNVFFILFVMTIITGCSIRGNEIYQTDNIAIDGFDTVAYFTDGEAIKGNSKYKLELSGVTWHFKNQKNLMLFKQSPKKYTPQYGGYCAYAMSYGLVVSSDPFAFSLIDDKLYLNYSFNVRQKWLRKKEQYIRKGNIKWQDKI